MSTSRRVLMATGLAAVAVAVRLAVRGSLTLDVGTGRRLRQLGPIAVRINAPRDVVFDVIAAPYLDPASSVPGKLDVLERGTDLVVAAHYTPTGFGRATTVEAVRFERAERVNFRLLRGPVPHVTETFELQPNEGGTDLRYRGELGTDFWRAGQWWGALVARTWERTVAQALDRIRHDAERRV